jgi:hypothetical protein
LAALDKGIPFTDARYLASASSKDIAEPFMCETDDKVPMVLERVETIKNAAKVLVEVCFFSREKNIALFVDNFKHFKIYFIPLEIRWIFCKLYQTSQWVGHEAIGHPY